MIDKAVAQLASWGLTPDDAQTAGLYPVADANAVDESYPREPAIIIPYHTPDGAPLLVNGQPYSRIRRLAPAQRISFAQQKPAKYLQPPRTGMHVYLPPAPNWREIMGDVRIPLIITEGEAKALAAAKHGFACVALGGVWSFTAPGGTLLSELMEFQWTGREVYVVFDSDAAENPQVVAAEARLIYALQVSHQARARVVRLPPGPDREKVGLDDYLRAHGPDAFDKLLTNTPALDALDAKVVAMNEQLAWIEFEGMAFNLLDEQFVKKDHLIKGSKLSSEKHIVPAAGRGKPKEISISDTWLTHPMAQRYTECLFRPDQPRVTVNDRGRPALNLYRPIAGVPGDVQPWLDLSAHIFQRMQPEHRDLAIKLMAYKAQHPSEKVPLALVFIGPQGSGKSLWGEIIRDAFAPYGADVGPKQLTGEFQSWLEKSLVALINEADGLDMIKGAEMIKSLISDLRRSMNEKFRPAREINSYTQYIITSNRRAVGSFAADDRRMIVIDIPPKREQAFYDRIRVWKFNGGPKHVLHYLQTLDLQGWRPPSTAPMTPEKYMAYREGLTQVQALAEDMRTADSHTIKLWLDTARAWADNALASNVPRTVDLAKAVSQTIGAIQIRPWYFPEELAALFPAVVQELQGGRFDRSTPAGQISRELREAGIPYLVNKDDPRGFMWKGHLRQFLVVADFDTWGQPMTQHEFDVRMKNWPTYQQLAGSRFK